MSMNKIRVNIFIFLVTLFVSTTTYAQSPSATVKGIIKDPAGTPLGRVSVQAVNSGKSTSTDENGRYTLTLSPGTYEITFSATGHASQTVTITLTPGATLVQDVVLAPQSSSSGAPIHLNLGTPTQLSPLGLLVSIEYPENISMQPIEISQF